MTTATADAGPSSDATAWEAAWPASGLDLGPAGSLRRRPFTEEDGDGLVGWFAGAHPELVAVPLPPVERDRLLRQQAEARQDQYRAAFPAAHHWVLELDGRPTGHLMVDLDGERCLVIAVEIDPAWQRRGLGGAALRAVVAVADDYGVAARLHVQADNPAQRLYERLGFAVVDDPADTVPLDLLMERPCPTSPT